ncbi:alpha-L-fucosidase-like [Ornithodoros turicata]|uniref:alpha-L-fucosidase-like n=1 Tax=Ornithodoros turicata TaxID=34597 RepID=UPI00313967D9
MTAKAVTRTRLLHVAVVAFYAVQTSHAKYRPNWKSLDTHRAPEWYHDAKIGIFINWGLFSVLGFEDESLWYKWKHGLDPQVADYIKKNYKPSFTYQDLAPMFTADFFNATKWVELFVASGARYVVLTSKHSDGYALWPSKVSPKWNSMDVGPRRDFIGELARAIKKIAPDTHFGLYYSLMEWFHPLYLQDRAHYTRKFPREKTIPELRQLVLGYQPEMIWSDGDRQDPESYWNSTGFLAWLYNDSPVRDTIVSNDRWGTATRNKHGDVWSEMDKKSTMPHVEHKWEHRVSLNRAPWGHRRNSQLADYLSIQELLAEIAKTISCNGNVLISVCPTKDGVISPIYELLLRQLGAWLRINGEAVYGTRSWLIHHDTASNDVWYTASKDGRVVYAFVLTWPKDGKLILRSIDAGSWVRLSMLGYKEELRYELLEPGLVIFFPNADLNLLPSTWAWVVKIEEAETIESIAQEAGVMNWATMVLTPVHSGQLRTHSLLLYSSVAVTLFTFAMFLPRFGKYFARKCTK